MKKRYLLLIPVVACIMVCAASIGYIQFHPDRAPEGARFLTQLAGTSQPQTDTGSAAPVDDEAVPDAAHERARELAANMTLEQKIYQLMFVSPEVLTDSSDTVVRAGDATKASITKAPVGGILYSSQNVQTREQVSSMLGNTQEYAKTAGAGIPMFLGIEEKSYTNATISQLLGIDTMDDGSISGEVEKAKELGGTLASSLSAIGFNVDFAPTADISATEDTEAVSKTVSSEISGIQHGGVLSAIAHFPGSGSIDSNTAEETVKTDRSLQEFQDKDLKVFRAGIEADASFIVVSNMTASAFADGPCSLSDKVVTDLLRKELGYDGIILTDRLTDAAITGSYATSESVVKALQAGADMLLCPPNINDSYMAISAAVTDGTITEEQITASVERILAAKLEYGLIS